MEEKNVNGRTTDKLTNDSMDRFGVGVPKIWKCVNCKTIEKSLNEVICSKCGSKMERVKMF